jgi:hypothetical protein
MYVLSIELFTLKRGDAQLLVWKDFFLEFYPPLRNPRETLAQFVLKFSSPRKYNWQ